MSINQLTPLKINLKSYELSIVDDIIIILKKVHITSQVKFFISMKNNKFYYDTDLEFVLENMFHSYKPSLEFGKIFYMISLINSGMVSWLMSINNNNQKYGHYYYLCIASYLLGYKYKEYISIFQKDLLFNYFVIIYFDIKNSSKEIEINIEFFKKKFNKTFNLLELDDIFIKQLEYFIDSHNFKE